MYFFLIRGGVWNTWFSRGEGYEIPDQLDGEGYEIPLKSDNGIRTPPPPVNNDNPLRPVDVFLYHTTRKLFFQIIGFQYLRLVSKELTSEIIKNYP